MSNESMSVVLFQWMPMSSQNYSPDQGPSDHLTKDHLTR